MTTLGQALDELIATVEGRASADPAASYTAKLIADGPARCAKKLGEEAIEAVLAAVAGDKTALAEESADVLYHLVVVLKACGAPPASVADALARRRAQSGLDEKASRES